MIAGYAACSCSEAEALKAEIARLRGAAGLAYLADAISIGRLAELLGCSIEDAQERAAAQSSDVVRAELAETKALLAAAAAELDRRDEALAQLRGLLREVADWVHGRKALYISGFASRVDSVLSPKEPAHGI